MLKHCAAVGRQKPMTEYDFGPSGDPLCGLPTTVEIPGAPMRAQTVKAPCGDLEGLPLQICSIVVTTKFPDDVVF